MKFHRVLKKFLDYNLSRDIKDFRCLCNRSKAIIKTISEPFWIQFSAISKTTIQNQHSIYSINKNSSNDYKYWNFTCYKQMGQQKCIKNHKLSSLLLQRCDFYGWNKCYKDNNNIKLKWVMLKLSNNSNNNENFEISVKVKRRKRKNLILQLSESEVKEWQLLILWCVVGCSFFVP